MFPPTRNSSTKQGGLCTRSEWLAPLKQMFSADSNSGDSFNTTMADSDEWLQRFKRDAKILHDEGPGLLAELQNV